jgi:hypothetical protein
MKLRSSLPHAAAAAVIALLATAQEAVAINDPELAYYFNFNDSGVANGQPASPAALSSDGFARSQTVITSNFNSPESNLLMGPGTTLNQHFLDGENEAGQGLVFRQGDSPGNNGNYIQFSIGDWSQIVLSYATTRSTGGFTEQQLSYSTDGTTFTTVGSFTAFDLTPGTFVVAEFDLTQVAPINAAGPATLRLTFVGATNLEGTNTIDNIQVNSIPEPATIMGGAMALGALCFSHLRRRAKRTGSPLV